MTDPAGALARGTEKAPDAYRTISEVANELGLPQHVLRFWESRFGQIRPLKRGGGRRYYRPEDIALLKGIQHLLYSEGYTIKGVQKLLKAQGVRAVQSFGGGRVVSEASKFETDDHDKDVTADRSAIITPINARVEPVLVEEPTVRANNEDALYAERPLPLFEQLEREPSSTLTATPAESIAPRLRALREELQACRDVLKLAAE